METFRFLNRISLMKKLKNREFKTGIRPRNKIKDAGNIRYALGISRSPVTGLQSNRLIALGLVRGIRRRKGTDRLHSFPINPRLEITLKHVQMMEAFTG